VGPRLAALLGRDGVMGRDEFFRCPFGEWLPLEVPQLIHLSCGEGFPGPFGQFPGDRDSGLGVAVAVFGHEPVIERGQLGIHGPGDAAGLVERQPQGCRPFLADGPARLVHRPGGPVRRGDADVVRCLLGAVESGSVAEVGADAGTGCRAHTGQGKAPFVSKRG
jgi:hypothetical protein